MKMIFKKTVLFFCSLGFLTASFGSPVEALSAAIVTENGLKIVEVKVGTGQTAEAGDVVTVHYVGTFEDGRSFDSSRGRSQPFQFQLGAGQVIVGWDQGIVGMKIGGVRQLTIPSTLAYGDRGIGPIPAKATLVFEVELLGIA